MNTRAFKTSALLMAAGALTFTLAGCSPDVPMDAAPDANNPECANVIVRLPKTLGDLERRYTNAQSTGAWGDPATVLLYCGIEPTGPTTNECINVDGIDWVVDGARAPLYSFEAYGRSPGLEIVIDAREVSSLSVLPELSSSVGVLPQERECTSVAESIDSSEFAP